MKYLLILLFTITMSVAQAESYALYHYDSNEYVESQDIDHSRSIASITKLFTAIVVLRSGIDLDQYVVADCTSHGHVAKGNRVTTRDCSLQQLYLVITVRQNLWQTLILADLINSVTTVKNI